MQIPTHLKEVNSIKCSHFEPRLFLTSGSDGFVKISDLNVGKTVFNFMGHRGQVHEAVFHPHKYAAIVGDNQLVLT